MNKHSDRLATLRVAVKSPDGSVTASLSHRAGFGLVIGEGAGRDHTDAELAAQVTAAINGTMAGYRAAMERVDEQLDCFADGDRRELKAKRQRARRALAIRCRDLKTVVVSPRGLVRITFTGLDRAECGVRPGTLRRTDVTLRQLAAEIVAARDTADREHRRRWRLAAQGSAMSG